MTIETSKYIAEHNQNSDDIPDLCVTSFLEKYFSKLSWFDHYRQGRLEEGTSPEDQMLKYIQL